MKRISIGVVALAAIVGGGYLMYLYGQSDVGLLEDDTCLKIVLDDVLGDPVYGVSCPKASYSSEVENLHGGDSVGAAIFRFRPVPGKEVPCPTLVVTVDRRTGEAWISQ